MPGLTHESRAPLNALRAFEAAARHENYVAAAQELGVSPGAISQQIKRLERWLGIKLFHRLAQGVQLTSEGRAGWPLVADALDELESAIERLKSAEPLER